MIKWEERAVPSTSLRSFVIDVSCIRLAEWFLWCFLGLTVVHTDLSDTCWTLVGESRDSVTKVSGSLVKSETEEVGEEASDTVGETLGEMVGMGTILGEADH